ncbi:hypothetical protein BGZ46_005333 [Entomortierella lignicola]|nr:hypothetical protein BGZ46_005333 [Entomortierella lignicola]
MQKACNWINTAIIFHNFLQEEDLEEKVEDVEELEKIVEGEVAEDVEDVEHEEEEEGVEEEDVRYLDDNEDVLEEQENDFTGTNHNGQEQEMTNGQFRLNAMRTALKKGRAPRGTVQYMRT